MTPFQHFCKYGAFEKDAHGDIGIDSSDNFDVSKYFSSKASQAHKSVSSVVNDFKKVHMDPIKHYANHGYDEGIRVHGVDTHADDAADAGA